MSPSWRVGGWLSALPINSCCESAQGIWQSAISNLANSSYYASDLSLLFPSDLVWLLPSSPTYRLGSILLLLSCWKTALLFVSIPFPAFLHISQGSHANGHLSLPQPLLLSLLICIWLPSTFYHINRKGF